MKKLILRIVLPLTIISMFMITEWWYALLLDGPDKMYWGFTFSFVGEDFHTSISLQFFMREWIID